ncbi:RagB/SusD family nutrient uptake outer membrane protein [Bacteroides sp. 214]|uniref:RagB/SusD family nutrient uptake outer membrane protein n=1 Tax=Bacteroides sp. 214 TaxID=2302935 RepID=UPI0013D44C6B|nr:RagB/SusD family nutrient uptake outer membrane protein [Bacteroides sp. 214]NDW11441.1 RagB/SusD family nutrient uptake outer membrane protein [Bacteroides sp. 214]
MKRYKNIYVFLLMSALALTMGGCEEWLNLEPNDGVPRGKFWRTKEDVHAAVTGIYASCINKDLVTRMFFYGEFRADLIQSGTTGKIADVQRAIEGEISDQNVYCKWNSFYNTINLCNTVLEFAPGVQAKDPSFTDKMLAEYEAQAVAIRSLMYFYLVRTFGDVPLTEGAYIDTSQNMNIAKSPAATVLNSLITDLRAAEKNIPYSYGSSEKNKGKATVWFVKALLADIYLWMENYEECNKLCDEIIKSGQFALVPVKREEILLEGETEEDFDVVYHANESDIQELFNVMYFQGNCVESIFELQFSTEHTNPFWSLMRLSRGTIMARTDVLSDQFFIPTNKDDKDYYDIREGLLSNRGYIWKYTGTGIGAAERAETEMTANYIIYRLAEIYLMKAEALTQMAVAADSQEYMQEAREALEKVRARANAVEATDLTYGETTYDGSTMERFILQERARELAYEGKRWFDVLRQAKRNNYDGLDYLMELALWSAPAEKVQSLQTKYKNYESHYLPIYKDELEANPLLVQNNFYKN